MPTPLLAFKLNKCHPTALQVLFCGIALLLPGGTATADPFQPKYDQARLHGPKDTEYGLLRVERNWRRFHDVGGRGVALEGDTVLVADGKNPKKPRSVRSADGRQLRWLGATGNIALFLAENTAAEAHIHRLWTPADIRRLDVQSCKWLPDWKVVPEANAPVREDSPEKPKEQRAVFFGDVLASEEAVILLTYTTIEHVNQRTGNIRDVYYETVGYEVTCFRPKEDAAKWSKSLPWIEGFWSPPMPGAVFRPSDDERLRRLNWLEHWGEPAVLVCAGGKQDLICFAVEEGEERWRTPRLWEFERGYVGPSTSFYFVDRFGLNDPMVHSFPEDSETPDEDASPEGEETKESLLEKRRKRFESDYEAWIVAGPVVPDEETGHVLVATARRRKNPEEGGCNQPAQCTVYELETESGSPTALTSVPRMVGGRSFKALSGAMIMSCARGALIRLGQPEQRFDPYIGPGLITSNKSLCRIAWYREYTTRFPSSWFWAGPPSDVAAFGKKRLFRPGPAYVQKKDKKVYRFRINVVDLRTGLGHDLTLAIPFQGEFPMPESNVGRTSNSTHAYSPHLLGIADLEVEKNILRVVMNRCEKDGEKVALEFDMGQPQ